MKITLKTGVKVTLNYCVPGSGSVVDFAQAVKCLYDGDKVGCLINTVSGVADLVSCGVAGRAIKKAMEKSAKAAAAQNLSKQVAIEMIEDAAFQTASEEATKKVVQQVAEVIAKEAVEEVWHEGTKMTLQTGLLALVSSGGHDVWKTTLEDGFEAIVKSGAQKLVIEITKQNNIKVVFELTKTAARTAAEEEFKKHSYKLIVTDVIVAGVKGTINYSRSANSDDKM